MGPTHTPPVNVLYLFEFTAVCVCGYMYSVCKFRFRMQFIKLLHIQARESVCMCVYFVNKRQRPIIAKSLFLCEQ